MSKRLEKPLDYLCILRYNGSANKNRKVITPMNKTQLIDVVAKNADLKKKDAEAAVSAVLAAIEDALMADDKVQIIGFGSFEVKARAAREGRNPKDPTVKIQIPASKAISFSASKALKDKLNG